MQIGLFTNHGSLTAGVRLSIAALCFALLFVPRPGLAIQYGPPIALSPSDADWLNPPISISGAFSIAGVSSYGEPGFPPFVPDMTGSGAAYIFESREDAAVVEHQLIASDGAAHDSFGYSAAIAGQLAVVGAPFDEESMNSQNTGSAYVFRYDGAYWIEEEKLIADDALASDQFGYSVAISDDAILVGAPKAFGSGSPGAVYVFRYVAGSWIQEDKITSSGATAGDQFGQIIALSGEIAVVGVPDNDDESDLGTVYLFRHDAGSWVEEDKLVAPEDSAQAAFGASFGETLAVSGETLLVGAYRGFDDDDPPQRTGAVYVYRYDGVDSWEQEAKFTGEGVNYTFHFGRAVAVSGDTAVVGTRGGGLSEYPAAVHVFWYDGASWVEQRRLDGLDSDFANFGEAVAISETKVLVGHGMGVIYLFKNIPDAKLTAADGVQSDEFGRAVALSGDMALVGAPGESFNEVASGAAYLFWYDGANWIDEDKLGAAGDGARFGTSVALDGDTAVIGASGAESTPGAAYVYQYSEDSWGAGFELTASNGAADDQFGRSVALSGGTIVVGAPEANLQTGAAYVYRDNGASWVEAELTASNGAEQDAFGSSVAILGDTLVIGAPAPERTNAGQAYVFRFDGEDWIQDAPLTASDSAVATGFGSSVALSSDTIAVTGSNAVYLFGDDGEDAVEEKKFAGSGTGPISGFGSAVAISDENTLVVGSEFDDGFVGAAYVYWKEGERWVEAPKFVASDTESWDFLGASVSISGDIMLVGAWQNEGIGAAYVSTVQYLDVPEPSLFALQLAALGALAFVAQRRRAF